MARFARPLGTLIVVLLLVGGLGLALRSGDETYEVTAYFEKAIGLFPNSDVTILGVPVGKVTQVDPVGSRVKVVMKIAEEHKVPADAFAQIVPISVIADRFVQLHPAYIGGPRLPDGAVLDTDKTQIPAELDDVFKQLKKLLEAIEPGEEGDPGALGSLIVALNDALADREKDLKGTIVNTSALTGALADAQSDLSGVLINLDDLFQKLATRAGAIGSLNRNFAVVMGALAESRDDLEGTLTNLADMTSEVGRVVKLHRGRLGNDLELASNVLSKVLENRSSVEESLSWLPVVGIGLTNAYHGGQNKDVDVRDNQTRLECSVLRDIPDSPVKDALRELCRAQTGEPPPQGTAQEQTDASPIEQLEDKLDCRESIRKVRRQLRKLVKVDLPAGVEDEIIEPLERKLRRLARECKGFEDALEKGDLLEKLDGEIGETPELDDVIEGIDTGDLTGSALAAGSGAVGDEEPGFFDRLRDWTGGFLDFVGWSW